MRKPAQPHRRSIAALLATTAIMFVASPALAQTDTPPQVPDTSKSAPGQVVQLGTVRVEDKARNDPIDSFPDEPGSYTPPGTTVGTRLPGRLRDVPQSVSVLTRQRLEDQNLQTLDQALVEVPGITVQQQTTVDSYFFSRGFQIDQVQLDGIPQDSPFASSFQPDLAIFERVEVLRGAAGLTNGAGSPGGVVNLVRKRPLAERRIGFAQSAGSWNNFRSELDLTGPLTASGSVRARVIGTFQDRDYFADILKSRRAQVYGMVEADLGSATVLTVGGGYQDFRSISDTFGLPRFSDGSDLHLRRSVFLGTDWSHYNFTQPEVYGELRHSFDDNWSLHVIASHRKAKSDLLNGYVFGPVNVRTRSGAYGSNVAYGYDERQDGVTAELTGSFEALGQRQDLVVGGNGYDKVAQTNFAGTFDPAYFPVDVFNFDPHAYPEPVRPPVADSTRNKVRQRGLYAATRLRPAAPLMILIGTRVSWYDSRESDVATGTVTSRYKQNGRFTPYGGAILTLDPRWSLYASYTDIFDPQNLVTFAGNQLPPVTGSNIEGGIKGELANGALNVSAAAFRIIQRNRSQIDPAHPGPLECAGHACYVADGKVRSQGLEAEVTGRVLPGWNVSVGYTFDATRYLRDHDATGSASSSEGTPFSTFTPRHIARVWTTYQLPGTLDRWQIGGGVNYQSATYKVSRQVRLAQSAYSVWSARLAYNITPELNLSVNGNNLFDKRYYTVLGNAALRNFYGEPRNVMVTLRGAFR